MPANSATILSQRISLLQIRESGDATQIWRYNDCGTPGALRLFSVANLLRKTRTKILLYEWPTELDMPRDGSRMYTSAPPSVPSYAALSHVWEASPTAARIANAANRPLRIDCGGPGGYVHTISWLGLVQAATAAAHFKCKYLWLDLLCLNQVSREDKALQIRNMARIYANAAKVIVMPGGIVAAQGLDATSTWMQRAWTFQEATLCHNPAVLIDWPLAGSFKKHRTGISVDKLDDGMGIVGLDVLLVITPGKLFEPGLLTVEKDRSVEWELEFPFRCLGDDKAVLDALNAGMRTAQGATPSNFDESTDDDGDTTYGDDDVGSQGGDEVRKDLSDNEPKSNSFKGLQGEQDYGSGEEYNRSDDDDDSTYSYIGFNAPTSLHIAAWRSMWLRTSTKPQDLVFSMMHYLGVSVAVSYKRPLEELIFELISKTPIPAWLTIGYDIPVNPKSGLLPILPTFMPNTPPMYTIDGITRRASELVFADYYCHKFDIAIKDTSTAGGHLVCARMLEVKQFSPPIRSQADPSFYDSEMSLSCPTLDFNAECHFKGSVGGLVVVIGRSMKDPHGFDDEVEKGIPFVHLLAKSEMHGTWQKTGSGTLDEPLFKRKEYKHGIVRRHLWVGGVGPAAELMECDCNKGDSQRRLDDSTETPEAQEDLDEALIMAASKANEHLIRSLLAKGANVNAAGKSHKKNGCPLQAACRYDKPRIVLLLIDEYGADVNGCEPWQYGTALQTACTWRFVRVARVLLERGADVNAPGGQDGPALHRAVEDKHLVQLLLDHGANVHALAEGGETALMKAAGSDSAATEDVLQILLNCGADINATDGTYTDYNSNGKTFRTLLQIACSSHTLRLVRFLIANGADVNVCAEGGSYYTALQVAAQNATSLICQELLKHGADVHIEGGYYGHALQAAAAGDRDERSEEVVRLLVERGADVNTHSGHYGNALQAAVATNMPHFKTVRYLLKQGADVNAVGGYWGTPLQGSLAADNSSREVVQLLLDHGADVNTAGVGYYGCALSAAAFRGNSPAEKMEDLFSWLLLEHGADVNAAGGYYGFPLQAAASAWLLDDVGLEVEVVRLFIARGADVNARGGYYGNALQAAAANTRSDVRVVQALLENGADVKARGGEFGSALQAAAHVGVESAEIIRLLVETGADVNHVEEKYRETIFEALRR